MLLDPMAGIALANDGHEILREIEVAHPAAESMIELSRAQDEEVGDGTTTVIILTGETLTQALPHSQRNTHPVAIIHPGFQESFYQCPSYRCGHLHSYLYGR